MQYGKIVGWIVNACTKIRRSQAKTLAEVVVGAMRCRRASLADVGRAMRGKALAKHKIKRVWRFVKNERVEVAEAAQALIVIAAKAARSRLFVLVDWVDVGCYKVLVAAVPIRGRSVPVLFAAYTKWALFKSQNAFEEGFLTLLRALLPANAQAVVVADRGFHRADLAKYLQAKGLHYVIRVNGTTYFAADKHSGRLDAVRLRPGEHVDLEFGAYRKSRPVCQRVVVYWKKHQNAPWFLATDLDWGWRQVVAAYALRMHVEQLFRDEKNLRYGWGLRQTHLSTPGRLERLLLVLAFAYLFLILLGLLARETLRPSHWASGASRKKKQNSLFTIGRQLQYQLHCSVRRLFLLFATVLSHLAEENWG
jgi:hypothetical protein